MSAQYEGLLTSSTGAKLAFLKEVYERSGRLDRSTAQVLIMVQAPYLNQLVRLLKDVGTSPHVVGTDPITIALAVDEAERLSLVERSAEAPSG